MWNDYNIELLEKFSDELKNNRIPKQIDATNNSGSTILHIASFMGHIPLIQQMLNLGLDVNLTNNNNMTSFLLASNKESLELLINDKNFDRKKNLDLIIDNEYCHLYQNAEALSYFLTCFKNEIKKLPKNRKIQFLQNLYQISQTDENVKATIISFIEKEKFHRKSLEIDETMKSVYIISQDTKKSQFQKWQKSNENKDEFKNKNDANIVIYLEKIQELIKVHNIVHLEIDKSYNVECMYSFLDNALKALSQVFNETNIGHNELKIKITNDQKDSHAGKYLSSEKKIVLTLNKEKLNNKEIIENNQLLLEEISVLAHEYTHYLQYRSLPYYQVYNLYEESFPEQWKDIIETVKTIKVTTKNCIDFLYATSISYVNIYQCNLNKTDIKNIKKYIRHYLYNENEDVLNDILLIIQNKIEPNFKNHYEQTKEKLVTIMKAVKFSLYNQEDGFYTSLWENIDMMNNNHYYNSEIEIHARLVQGIYFNTNNLLDGVIPNQIKNKLKIKLEKFNNLVKGHEAIFCKERSIFNKQL